jgi:hypothetical protein
LSVVQKAGKIGVQKWRENERNNEHDKIVQHFPQGNNNIGSLCIFLHVVKIHYMYIAADYVQIQFYMQSK